jgi:protein decreased size exclusion limit 1
VGDVRIRGDGRIVALAGWDHKVRVYDWRRRTPLAVLKYHTRPVAALAFAPDPTAGMLATAARDGTVALWEVYPAAAGGKKKGAGDGD